ncbi:transporter substrate-binding domain-containing protein [Sneathiella sp. P13V-1]|uniref:substrate-binding periplasmic protein n=1 Tax=Sneathiella sp. P13V-1 TaxID=2697366 RepID=UPI00187BC3D9|nr:transporter substrate-binding domain-containing protein [Sneathiella sp. P13V-1]MBE7636988.1 transporter substrate-binding domain-containing protein [Sneathiella sp. P13V-1]
MRAFFFLFVFTFICRPVWANEKLTIVTDIWPPYVTNENGQIGGTSTDIVKKTLTRNGIEFQIIKLPWARAYEMALQKKNIAIYTIVRTKNREHLFQWISELHQSDPIYFYSFKKSQPVPKNLNELKNHKISVVRQSMSLEALQRKGFPPASILKSVEEFEAIRLVTMGRADFVATSEKTLKSFEKLYPGVITYSIRGPELLNSRLYIALNKNSSTELVRRLKAAFTSLENKSPTN